MASRFSRPYTFDRVVRIIFTIVIIIGVLYLINRLSGALLPFLVAWLLAYLIHPVVVFFQKKLRVKNKLLAILCTLISITVFFTSLGWLFLPSIFSEMDKVGVIIKEFLASSNQVPFLPDVLHNFVKEKIDFNQLATMMDSKEFVKFVEDLLSRIWTIVSGSVNQIINLVSWLIVILYLVFILLDYDKILTGFKNLIPKTYRPLVIGIMTDVENGMNRYFRGQALIAFLVGILFSIGFLIIGLPLAIPLGLFIGALNMVPYLQVIGVIPTVLLCLLDSCESGSSFWLMFFLSMTVFAVVQIIQDGYLVPRIMGRVTGLNPAIILLSLSIWGSLMGVIGMIIALPLTTLILSYYQRYILNPSENREEDNEQEKKDC